MKGFYLSAAHKSSGKTTISIGLAAALVGRGYRIQTFKKGPDYIDPMWLTLSSGRSCYNLDFHTQTNDEIAQLVASRSADADFGFVEGNKGLFDGLDIQGSNSNAALARFLELPVILVLDTVGTIRGIAPLVLGYQAFDTELTIAGVILNKVGGPRHESKLIQVMEAYTDVPVLGAVGRVEEVRLLERHLGLIPSNEASAAKEKVSAIGRVIAESVDLDRVIQLADSKPETSPISFDRPLETANKITLRLGIAKDAAFGFYYADDLDRLSMLGAELIPVDMLVDDSLPDDLDGLFIGGGFPESFAEELSANRSMRESVAAAIESGLPVYAECGGLMYLSQSLDDGDSQFDMVGVIPGRTVMHGKPVGRGYTRLKPRDTSFWGYQEGEIHAHEFHYSSLEWQQSPSFEGVFEVLRGHGIDGHQDGYRYRNLVAGYTHMRNTQGYPWCDRFIEFMKQHKQDAMSVSACVVGVCGD